MTAPQTAPNFTADDMRLLDQDEAKLVEAARGDLAEMSASDLSDTLQRLRDRRDRARDLANRQRREARGKADPSGVNPATHNAGSEGKARVLGLALDLVAQERQRRSDAEADPKAEASKAPSQQDLSQKAMALKEAGSDASPMQEDGGPLHPQDPEADPGKGAMADQARNIAPSGALDHGGELPSRERSRTRY
ncbi:MAG: hypothetical protein U0934_08970 [Pseudotabrizicola sp.]|uniref:hypothetical protein n=1 Tax=Pseudotabrizicola sp. TaxID=2939647 RepID=UPI00271AA0B3|nr:hypothetical protein [Pseudotabrizicola sp.]MDO8883755.1 hypothetical protein [Pseudotabrizicola sp.]MDP2081724.1 hypothetical protein [Pseudotabrizicola sp.]MDZ7574075.1 hypothetical protein [Pseudotabrizicola sp.]